MGKATKDLRKEHDAILFVLKILDKMMSAKVEDSVRLPYYGELVDFLKIFADKCHHGKEENYLFKELVEKGIENEGGPVGAMLKEHAQGRMLIARMSESLDSQNVAGFQENAIKYSELLRNHIEKENNILFNMADTVLDEEAQEDLFEKFEQHEENVIGHGVHEKLHANIHKWAEKFGV